MDGLATGTALRARHEGGGTRVLEDWGVDSEYGVLRDVLVGSADAFRWLGEENARYSAVVRSTLRKGHRFDRELALRQHGEMLDAYRSAGVTVHQLETREELAYGVYTRDSSVMTPFGAVVCQLANPRRRGEYATTLRFYLANEIPIYDLVTAGSFEGGDFAMLEPGCALIGYTGARGEEIAARQVGTWLEAEGIEVVYSPIDEYYVHLDLLVCMLGEKLAAVCLDADRARDRGLAPLQADRDRPGPVPRHDGTRLQRHGTRKRPGAVHGAVRGAERAPAGARLHRVRPGYEPVLARRRRHPLPGTATASRPRIESSR